MNDKYTLLTKTLDLSGYPIIKPIAIEDLFSLLQYTHGAYAPDEDTDLSLSVVNMVGAFFLDVPIFFSSSMYEIMECRLPYSQLTLYIKRLIDRGSLKSVRLSAANSDSTVNTLYYLTKPGYEGLSSFISNCTRFKSRVTKKYTDKKGKRFSDTAQHDIGAAGIYLSFVRSPFVAEPSYEVSYKFDRSAMPAGKHAVRSLRTDVVIDYHSDETFGKLYFEHDTGSEYIRIMMDKLVLYQAHQILVSNENGKSNGAMLYEQNAIVFSFRKKYEKKPSCFSARKILRLASLLNGASVDTFQTDDPKLSEVLGALSRWTDAFRKHWDAEDLTAFARRLEARTDIFLMRYLRYYQRSECAKRRNAAFNFLTTEYMKGKSSSYYSAILEMLDGYPVWFLPFNNISNCLPALFMCDYPQTISWIQKVLMPYYGHVTYHARHLTIKNNSGGKDLNFSNVFTTEEGEYIAVEYVSCDLSALLRLYLICKGEYELKRTPFNMILIVDSVKDANYILDKCEPRFKMGMDRLFKSGVLDLSFLSLNGSYLFGLNPDGKEVKLVQ